MLGRRLLSTFVLAALAILAGDIIMSVAETSAPKNFVVSQNATPSDNTKLKKYYDTWTNSSFLAHVHQTKGLNCAACHADPKNPEPVEADTCMRCHNPEKVAAATEKMAPANPHNSPHYGKQADCNLCHHQHEKSEDYCAKCHKFNFNVP
jgi:Cytochrome c3